MVSAEEGAVGEDAEMMPNTGDLTRMKYRLLVHTRAPDDIIRQHFETENDRGSSILQSARLLV